MTIVQCSNIHKRFPICRGYFKEAVGTVNALDGVSLEIEKGESFGLVGESGCGKTTLGKIILGILKPDSGKIELVTNKVQVIFQDPYNSLDPRMRIQDILAEGLILRELGSLNIDDKRIGDTLDLVMLPRSALKKYPHQFSGGERQRIAIARAIITRPELIVCDEPVSSLDVTIQLEILKLLKDIQKKLSATYLFISHDLRVIRYMCGRVAVMKDGRIIEEGLVRQVYSKPSQLYTQELLASILDINTAL